MEDLGEHQEKASVLLCDSKSAIALALNLVFHGRSKQIEVKHHFIRELIPRGKVNLVYCNTNENVADIFTKALPEMQFIKLRSMLGVWDLNQGGVLKL